MSERGPFTRDGFAKLLKVAATRAGIANRWPSESKGRNPQEWRNLLRGPFNNLEYLYIQSGPAMSRYDCTS
jgi:hypothetical protein